MSLYVTFRDLLATSRCHSLAYALSLAILSFPGLPSSPYCLILPSSLLLSYLSTASGPSIASYSSTASYSSIAGCSSIAVVYSYASPIYIALDF